MTKTNVGTVVFVIGGALIVASGWYVMQWIWLIRPDMPTTERFSVAIRTMS